MIECAACEPEVEDLADLLNAMGARISGAGTPRVTIEGVEELHGADHTVIPDRIEAGTYVIAAAITNGSVTLENFPTRDLTAFLDRLAVCGVTMEGVGGGGGGPPLGAGVGETCEEKGGEGGEGGGVGRMQVRPRLRIRGILRRA